MSGVGLFGAVVIGMIAGWIAGLLLNRRHGTLANLALGVSGACIGALLTRSLDIRVAPGFIPSLLVSSAGAILLLAVLSLLRRRRR